MTYELDVPNEVYHQEWPGYSSTFIKTAYEKSLYHARYGYSSINPSIADFGTAIHSLTLEPEKDHVRRGPARRGTNIWKEQSAEAEAAGAVLLPEKEYDVAHKAAQKLLDHPSAGNILKAEDKICEASITLKHPRTGLQLKIRPDIYVPSTGVMADVKTTVSSDPRLFARQAWSLGYPISAAYYKMVAEMIGWDVNYFCFLTVEKTEPYAAHCHHLSVEALERGHRIVEMMLDKIACAERENAWTTGWGNHSMLDVPEWMTKQDQEIDDV